MNQRFLCAATTIAVALCLTNAIYAETYYPLTPHARYEYRVKASRDEAKQAKDFNLSAVITMMDAQVLEGKTVTPERHEISGEFSNLSFVTEDATGVYYFALQQPNASRPQVIAPQQYLIRYPIEIGRNWFQKSSEFEILNENRKLPVTLVASIESKAETVTVPAGSFTNCLKIKMLGSAQENGSNQQLQFKIEKDLWYAPGVGLVKSVQEESKTSNINYPLEKENSKGKFSIVMVLQTLQYQTEHFSRN